MKIPNAMIVNSVDHRYAGNNWAVIETYPDDWARVANFFKDKQGDWKIASQFFLVWQNLLTPSSPIHPDLVGVVMQIRNDLASGKKAIQNTRLVEA